MTYQTFTSAQDIFDHVAPLLYAQGQRSMFYHEGAEEWQCAYRGGDNGNLRCAVGFILPDELYRGHLEGLGVEGEEMREVLKDIIPLEDRHQREHIFQFLGNLQDIHDSWIIRDENKLIIDEPEPAVMRARLLSNLTKLALRFELNTKVLDTLTDGASA